MSNTSVPNDDYSVISKSEFFDAEWYKMQYNIKTETPEQHYFEEGWKMGFNPGPRFFSDLYCKVNFKTLKPSLCPLYHYEQNKNKKSLQIYTQDFIIIKNSDFFDADWYKNKYLSPDVSDEEAVYHYLFKGWKLGYDPSANFVGDLYFYLNPDVKKANVNPLLHYARNGCMEHRQCTCEMYLTIKNSILFNSLWYSEKYLFETEKYINPIVHYMSIGWKLGYNPGPNFNNDLYLCINADVAEAGICPLYHFEKVGRSEGRECTQQQYAELEKTKLFDVSWYARVHKLSDMTKYQIMKHYLNEGWLLGYNPSEYFNGNQYLQANEDVKNAKINPLLHFLRNGSTEKRKLYSDDYALIKNSEYFDVAWYRENNMQDEPEYIDPIEHYLTKGYCENKNPSPDFNAEMYLKANPGVAILNNVPLLHYEKFGKKNGLDIYPFEYRLVKESEYFDAKWYSEKYLCNEEKTKDPVADYITEGYKIGRDPSEYFSNEAYVSEHKNINAGVAPLVHYLLVGKVTDKSILSDDYVAVQESGLFDKEWYLNQYGEKCTNSSDPLLHYITTGWKMGFNPSPLFNGSMYAKANMDKMEICPLLDYLSNSDCRRIPPTYCTVIDTPAEMIKRPKNKTNSSRIGIFMCYDANGVFDDYVFYMLDSLSQCLDSLVIVVNGLIKSEYLEKYKEYAETIVIRPNIGFDTGAWQDVLMFIRGFEEISKYDEVVFLNDSFFGPFKPFTEIFADMSEKDIDFWGLSVHGKAKNVTENFPYECRPRYIQSYFLVVKQRLSASQEFKDFWRNLPLFETFKEVAEKFGCILTKHFEDMGYKWAVYADTEDLESQTLESNMSFHTYDVYRMISERNFPVFKRKTFVTAKKHNLRYNGGAELRKAVDYVKKNSNYDMNLILKYLLRNYDISDLNSSLNPLKVITSNEEFIEKSVRKRKVACVVNLENMQFMELCFSYLEKLPKDIDLIIASSNADYINEIETRYRKSLKSQLTFISIPQKHTGPFSAFFAGCRNKISEYDYVCFLHDELVGDDEYISIKKADIVNNWDNLIKNSNYIGEVLREFDKDDTIGVFCPPHAYHAKKFTDISSGWQGDFNKVSDICLMLNVSSNISANNAPLYYGSSFWCKTAAIKNILDFDFEYADFYDNLSLGTGNLNTAYEKSIPYIAAGNGYYVYCIESAENISNTTHNLFVMFNETLSLLTSDDTTSFSYEELLQQLIIKRKAEKK